MQVRRCVTAVFAAVLVILGLGMPTSANAARAKASAVVSAESYGLALDQHLGADGQRVRLSVTNFCDGDVAKTKSRATLLDDWRATFVFRFGTREYTSTLDGPLTSAAFSDSLDTLPIGTADIGIKNSDGDVDWKVEGFHLPYPHYNFGCVANAPVAPSVFLTGGDQGVLTDQVVTTQDTQVHVVVTNTCNATTHSPTTEYQLEYQADGSIIVHQTLTASDGHTNSGIAPLQGHHPATYRIPTGPPGPWVLLSIGWSNSAGSGALFEYYSPTGYDFSCS